MRGLYKSAVMLDGGGVSLSPRWRFSTGAYCGTDLVCCSRCETFCESNLSLLLGCYPWLFWLR